MTTQETKERLAAWFAGQLPDNWFTTAPEISADGEEILVVGTLTPADLGSEAGEEAVEIAAQARIDRWREDTRAQRMRIAEDAQQRFDRRVSWGASVGTITRHFTTAAVPVMTRLRMTERQVLDTLIEAGVARSRSEALAWCVRLVGKNQAAWIADLKAASQQVEAVRAQGPA
jgi:hypothetical protein